MTLGLLEEWRSIDARIEALVSSVRLASELADKESNVSATYKVLFQRTIEVLQGISDFAWVNFGAIPRQVFELLNGQGELWAILNGGDPGASMRSTRLIHAVVLLNSLRAEVNFLLSDHQADLVSRTERAILHLQWSIAIDPALRIDWQQAYNAGEPACEALGAAHLLMHGIFAFKVHTNAARTDLVYDEPISDQMALRVEGLVLTEWKRATSKADLPIKIQDAKVQADGYAGGVLAGRELRKIRYIIAVTEQQMPMPDDDQRDGYLYRHLNIAVRPASPSKLAATLNKS